MTMKNIALTIMLAVGFVAAAAASVLFFSEKKAATQRAQSLEDEITKHKIDHVALQKELENARTEIARLSPEAKRGRELPIKIGQRSAVLGSGNVLQIQNLSTRPLPVKVKFTSPTFNKTRAFDLVLDPASVISSPKEIGHAEGWAVAPGDEVEIFSEGFDPKKQKF
jgi:hypothetical protein